jgi:hypothetical protein
MRRDIDMAAETKRLAARGGSEETENLMEQLHSHHDFFSALAAPIKKEEQHNVIDAFFNINAAGGFYDYARGRIDFIAFQRNLTVLLKQTRKETHCYIYNECAYLLSLVLAVGGFITLKEQAEMKAQEAQAVMFFIAARDEEMLRIADKELVIRNPCSVSTMRMTTYFNRPNISDYERALELLPNSLSIYQKALDLFPNYATIKAQLAELEVAASSSSSSSSANSSDASLDRVASTHQDHQMNESKSAEKEPQATLSVIAGEKASSSSPIGPQVIAGVVAQGLMAAPSQATTTVHDKQSSPLSSAYTINA